MRKRKVTLTNARRVIQREGDTRTVLTRNVVFGSQSSAVDNEDQKENKNTQQESLSQREGSPTDPIKRPRLQGDTRVFDVNDEKRAVLVNDEKEEVNQSRQSNDSKDTRVITSENGILRDDASDGGEKTNGVVDSASECLEQNESVDSGDCKGDLSDPLDAAHEKLPDPVDGSQDKGETEIPETDDNCKETEQDDKKGDQVHSEKVGDQNRTESGEDIAKNDVGVEAESEHGKTIEAKEVQKEGSVGKEGDSSDDENESSGSDSDSSGSSGSSRSSSSCSSGSSSSSSSSGSESESESENGSKSSRSGSKSTSRSRSRSVSDSSSNYSYSTGGSVEKSDTLRSVITQTKQTNTRRQSRSPSPRRAPRGRRSRERHSRERRRKSYDRYRYSLSRDNQRTKAGSRRRSPYHNRRRVSSRSPLRSSHRRDTPIKSRNKITEQGKFTSERSRSRSLKRQTHEFSREKQTNPLSREEDYVDVDVDKKRGMHKTPKSRDFDLRSRLGPKITDEKPSQKSKNANKIAKEASGDGNTITRRVTCETPTTSTKSEKELKLDARIERIRKMNSEIKKRKEEIEREKSLYN